MNPQSIIYPHVMISMSEVIGCDYCKKTFPSNRDGIIEKTFHIILSHGEMVNK